MKRPHAACMSNHYEKVITFCCFLFIFVNIGFPSTSFGVYQPYIVQIVGDTAAMMVLAVRTLVSLAAIVFVDRYYRLLDCRVGIFVATMLTTAGFIIYSFANGLPLFLLAAATTGFGYGLGGMVGMTTLTRRWYANHTERIGGAVGFASVGSGVASIIIPIAAIHVIENVSLHASFRLEAAIAFTVGIIAFALLRNNPPLAQERKSPKALAAPASSTDAPAGPDATLLAGEPNRETQPPSRPRIEASDSATSSPENPRATAPASSSQTLGAHVSRHEYHLLILGAVCIGVMCVGGPAYVTVYFTDCGVVPVLAATLLSVQGLCLTVSKYATGKLFDAVGTRRGSAVMFAFATVGLAAMCAVGLGATGIAPVAVVLYGIGLSLGTVGISVWSLELASPANMTRSIKNYQVAYSLGGFVANTFPGPLKELTGSYLCSYAIMLVAAAYAAIVIVGTYVKYRNYTVAR